MAPDVVRDVAGVAESSSSACGWGIEVPDLGDGVAFLRFGEGGGIGKGCKVREPGVGVPTDWAQRGARSSSFVTVNVAARAGDFGGDVAEISLGHLKKKIGGSC